LKTKYLIGIPIIIVFVILGALSFRKTLTPYVSFEQAKKSGAVVQVIGRVVLSQVEYDTSSHQLTFPLADDSGNRMQVEYSGTKPGNFEQADKVVVIGSYRDGVFTADQLLVKCPSKYQGASAADSAGMKHPSSIPKQPL
jgi:cytochrome c-type biogenesis protein CcmE